MLSVKYDICKITICHSPYGLGLGISAAACVTCTWAVSNAVTSISTI